MLPTRRGSLRLFQVAGIEVFLHWSWFIVALIMVETRVNQYSSYFWNALEYVGLFVIVLMHEFGHALACRQVGGSADQIILWPLGGVAYVSPPQRPGATLWSIAAGPLVNVALTPILGGLFFAALSLDLSDSSPNVYLFVRSLFFINVGILIFNLLPVYPLDGGQILRSLLWFPLGRARSLMAASAVGFLGVGGLVALGVWVGSPWMGVMAAFVLLHCWRGLIQARALARLAQLPRRDGFACPVCLQRPVLGPRWRCAQCLKPFDTFETFARCPHCGAEFPNTQCLDCGNSRPIAQWVTPPPVLP
jgi:Zn-dependent protease